jgi:pyruvate dehydrogenase E1 component
MFPVSRATPLITVLDSHPHTLAFLATINLPDHHQQGARHHPGVTRFGQSGSVRDVYRSHGIDTDSIVRAGLDLANR